VEEEELEVTVGLCEVETVVPRTRGKNKNEKEKEGRGKGEYASIRLFTLDNMAMRRKI
jgi:hypothetical protein